MSEPDSNDSAWRSILGSFPTETFFREHFQKSPLFLPQALPGFTSPLSPEELAGLACDESIESRLIENTFPGSPSNTAPWSLSHGPFSEADFETLDEDNWTLLIQDVDKHIPDVERLLSLVRFLPSWSIDDIMISFATPGGNVGPHTDQYDVFLVQAQGTRRWELAQAVDESRMRKDTDLKVLDRFAPDTTHIARPGDVLYIPPHIGHYGIAEDDCITFSFGFRAPTTSDLLEAYLSEALSHTAPSLLREPLTRAPRHSAELSENLKREVALQVDRCLSETRRSGRWLGKHLTSRKPHLPEPPVAKQWTDREFLDALSTVPLQRTLATRFLFEATESGAVLYVDGECHCLDHLERPVEFAVLLTETDPLTFEDLRGHLPSCRALLKVLVDAGQLEFCTNHEKRRST